MPMVVIHAELAFVVCSPKPKGDKPSVQQTGVVRVFDVLLHELPVAWNALLVVTQNFQLAAIEQTIKVPKDGGPHEVFQGLHFMVERSKHHPSARCHFQRIQAMVFGIKICRHAAIDLAVLANAAPEWHALQFAIQRIAPLVVRTHKFFFITVSFATKRHAPMRAHIFNHMDMAILTPRHDHRALTNDRPFEVTQIGDFCF